MMSDQGQQQATSSLPAHVVQNLVEKCVQAKINAYAPYSKFRVGCALLTEDGQIYTGMCPVVCSVPDNVSFILQLCHVLTALYKY